MRYDDVRKQLKYSDKLGCCNDFSRACDWFDDFTGQRECDFKDMIIRTVLEAFVGWGHDVFRWSNGVIS